MAVKGNGGRRGARVPAPSRPASPQPAAAQSTQAAPSRSAPSETEASDHTNTETGNAADPAASANVNSPEREYIAVAAYYRAEQRGFTGDQQVDDWLAAEKALAAESAPKGDDDLKARGYVEEDIQPDEVEQWAERLQVSPERLRVAIQRVGPVSSEVEKFLQDPGGR
ncbi:MAG: hypothetical protein JWN94_786 [Betaproteobacteria bacterium]|nr:hypothetical protein [Betaproteobacteria bacterium]